MMKEVSGPEPRIPFFTVTAGALQIIFDIALQHAHMGAVARGD